MLFLLPMALVIIKYILSIYVCSTMYVLNTRELEKVSFPNFTHLKSMSYIVSYVCSNAIIIMMQQKVIL